MYEAAWQEINNKGAIVSKRKTFKTEAALEKFIANLFKKDGFHRILAYSN